VPDVVDARARRVRSPDVPRTVRGRFSAAFAVVVSRSCGGTVVAESIHMSKATKLIPFPFLLLAACAAEQLDVVEIDHIDELGSRSNDAICGDHTIASARAPSGNRVVFCVVDGVEIVAEGGTAEPLPNEGGCGLDTFIGLTDASTPVPAQLVDACRARGGDVSAVSREITPKAVFTTSSKDDVASADVILDGEYCGADGATAFSQRCDWQCSDSDGNDVCATWCKPSLVASSLNAISQILGEQGNRAREILASCNGATRFRGMRDRGAIDPAYRTLYDIDVQSGQTWYVEMSYEPLNGEDAFFMFRGDTLGGQHRHTGEFFDRK
jgi:hypothetical protein